LDGWRVIVKVGDAATVPSRSGRDITACVPEAWGGRGRFAAMKRHEVVLDGELIAGEGRACDLRKVAPRVAASARQAAFSIPALIAGVATTKFGLHSTALVYSASADRSSAGSDAGIPASSPRSILPWRTHRNAVASAIPSPAATSPSLPARPGPLNDHRRQLRRIRTRHDFLRGGRHPRKTGPLSGGQLWSPGTGQGLPLVRRGARTATVNS